MKFLFFTYTLPTKATKGRVQVWRFLKKIGAVSYRALWVSPFAKDKVASLQELGAIVTELGGESLIFEGKLLNDHDEKRVLEELGEASRQEYTELLGVCKAFLDEIRHETEIENFIFAEVEENEEELEKIKKWLKKIQKREVVQLEISEEALEAVKHCEDAFEMFSELVFKKTTNT